MNEAVPQRTRWLWRALIGLVLVGAAVLRLYGQEWDGGFLMHPDERQILVVADGLKWPQPFDLALLLSPDSPWNPKFFAYGSLPLYLLRCISWLAGRVNPDYASLMKSYQVGRLLSALFDLGTVYLIWHLGRKLFGRPVALLAAAFTALAVLHIQLAHFYTVDTLLTFFVVLCLSLSVDLLRHPTLGRGALAGIAWGLALATKVSAAPLIVPLALAWALGIGLRRRAPEARPRKRSRDIGLGLFGLALTGLCGLATFLLFEPYALLDVITFLVDVLYEGYMVRGAVDVPYTRQYIGTLPYLYPIWQAIKWSLGIPLGLTGFGATLAALVATVVAFWRRRWQSGALLLLPLSWVLIYFGLTGGFHTKFLRYLLPITPLLALFAAWVLLGALGAARRRAIRGIVWAWLLLVCVGTGAYALAYMNVYRQEHPWIQATRWLCTHLLPGDRLMVEHWDDPLPMLQGTGDLDCQEELAMTRFPVYDPDDAAKLEQLLTDLQSNDYIVISSNRLYDTVSRLPERYPLMARYYELLFSEQLGYELVYYAAVYPRLCGVSLVDDTFSDPVLPRPRLLQESQAQQSLLLLGRADESYSVYDHPMPMVFKKTRSLGYAELRSLFADVAERLPATAPAD